MSEISHDELVALCEAEPEKFVEALLAAEFWLPPLEPNMEIRRYGDDTRLGNLSVIFSRDSDGHLNVFNLQQENDPDDLTFHLRFRTYFGGGESEKTRKALLVLALAMMLDNKEHPQQRKLPT